MNKHEETKEQAKTVTWCKEQGLEVYGTAQATYTTSWWQINQNRSLGVRKGVSDLIIFIPAHRSVTGTTQLIFLEMKKIKGGITSPEQKFFLDLANQVKGSVYGVVCKGYEAAVQYLTPLLTDKPELTEEEVEQVIKSL